MLGADIVMVQATRLIHRQLDHLLGARGQANLAQDDAVAATDDEFDGAAHFVELDTEVAQYLRRHAVAFTHEAEEQMLGADIVVVEALGFFLSQAQDFPGPLSKLVELFVHLISPLSR